MNVNLYNFDLPEYLIAQTPLENRTKSRLLTLDKTSGDVKHKQFEDFIHFLQPEDTLVLNNTKVIPARLFGIKKHTGAKAEVLLLKNLANDRWEALVKPAKRLKKGSVIEFGTLDNPLLTAEVEEESEMGQRVLKFSYDGIFPELLDQLGHMPLPPYIKEQLEDKDRYQTVFAKEEGSAAAPTAGLHFTESYLNKIKDKGVKITYVTLHVGLGTFRPVSVEDIHDHKMHSEYYEISEECANTLNESVKSGGRIIGVGTTVVRTLETAANHQKIGEFQACNGWTDIFIYPGYELKLVNALLTNFHLPKSTLLMLISAFAGREKVLQAYQEAIQKEYRFFSFGDAMFIY
ncbi:tRNA preQ1(34) S-adenosylmethionine ribosyltransferase-isomerase QueA [Chengkuizengella sediminis]|uniref:tRNA preQ1(34) S-adenosylmethionine ribosyltransferase-isomerase QueA n=1 Tax=Chengkuizengella sediminis TaxID=1885917 RepID=UPI00138A319C|nr:tRNA preQ1(34) S-adenosylmethionine ribosyltransferase-isomerase QueA [Chengkuizengella sediminis]NDI34004.1 tRNA preQ1(34) S-adenosylmethionine ribosyltransferase-isomerase QueA [Chengkuizengella sediminis]